MERVEAQIKAVASGRMKGLKKAFTRAFGFTEVVKHTPMHEEEPVWQVRQGRSDSPETLVPAWAPIIDQ